MKKNYMYIFIAILIAYLIFHTIYTIYMFTTSIGNGLIWAIILLLELFIVYLGYSKYKVLNIILVIALLLNSYFSLFILLKGNDFNTKNADYVLVLGYELDHNKMSDTLKYRLDKAYKYAKSNKDAKLILCGGITGKNNVSEASVMYDYLKALGIDEERLVKEDQSTDTIENIKNSLHYITINSKIVVISSQYHVFRAKQICKLAGIEVKGIGSQAPLLLYPNQLLFEKLGLIKMLIKM